MMANESFLAGLAGAVSGISEGLKDLEDRRRFEQERAFRLKKYEDEQRRNAMLDALNQEVSKGRLDLMQRAQEIAEKRFQAEQEQMELIPHVLPSGETVQLTRAGAQALGQMEAQALAERDLTKYPVTVDGEEVYLSGEELARRHQEEAETGRKRREHMERILSRMAEQAVSTGQIRTPEELGNFLLPYAKLLFPDEFVGIDVPGEEVVGEPTAEIQGTEAENLGFGGFVKNLSRRLFGPPYQEQAMTFKGAPLAEEALLPPSVIGGVEGRLVELLRRGMYGPAPPQTPEELREAQLAGIRSPEELERFFPQGAR